MPVKGTTPSKGPTPSKYAMLCIGVNTKEIGAAIAKYTGDASAASTYGGVCSDGLNEAGLSGAMLWDQDNAGNETMPVKGTDVSRAYHMPLAARVPFFNNFCDVHERCDTGSKDAPNAI